MINSVIRSRLFLHGVGYIFPSRLKGQGRTQDILKFRGATVSDLFLKVMCNFVAIHQRDRWILVSQC